MCVCALPVLHGKVLSPVPELGEVGAAVGTVKSLRRLGRREGTATGAAAVLHFVRREALGPALHLQFTIFTSDTPRSRTRNVIMCLSVEDDRYARVYSTSYESASRKSSVLARSNRGQKLTNRLASIDRPPVRKPPGRTPRPRGHMTVRLTAHSIAQVSLLRLSVRSSSLPILTRDAHALREVQDSAKLGSFCTGQTASAYVVSGLPHPFVRRRNLPEYLNFLAAA